MNIVQRPVTLKPSSLVCSASEVVVASGNFDPKLSPVPTWTTCCPGQHPDLWYELCCLGSNVGNSFCKPLFTGFKLDKLFIQLVSAALVLCWYNLSIKAGVYSVWGLSDHVVQLWLLWKRARLLQRLRHWQAVSLRSIWHTVLCGPQGQWMWMFLPWGGTAGKCVSQLSSGRARQVWECQLHQNLRYQLCSMGSDAWYSMDWILPFYGGLVQLDVQLVPAALVLRGK